CGEPEDGLNEFVYSVKRSDPNSGEQNSADGEHDESDDWENELAPDGFVFEAVINHPEAEGNQCHAGNVLGQRPGFGEEGVPATEEKYCCQAGNRDHRGVFGDEEHGELEASVFRVEARDEFGFGFGKIERGAIGFCNGRSEEADEANNLREQEAVARPADDIPAKKANVFGIVLLFNQALQAKGILFRHEQHTDNGHGECELIADHLRGAAQAAEERILGVRSPACQSNAVNAESSDREEYEQPDVWIRYPEINLLAEKFEWFRAKGNYSERSERKRERE